MVYSLGQRYLAFVVGLATSIVLARLLRPEETGIFSLAMAAVAIGAILREFGTSDYIISQRDVSPQKLRAAYTVTLLISWSAALLLLAAARPLATLYKEPGVATVMYVLCLNFMLVPLGSTAMAMLSKELRFDLLFWIQSASMLVGAVTTLLCAFNGVSYQSAAWGSVASISTVVLVLSLRRPSSVFMLPTFRGLRQIFRFGGVLTLARVVEGVATRVGDFVISGMLGFHSSGVLSKANSLNGGFHEFFASAVLRVATPVLAQARQGGRSVADDYRHATVLMASAQWLFFGVMIVVAPELVYVLFGPSWIDAVPLLQIGAVAGFIYAPFMLCTPLLTAFGAARPQLTAFTAYCGALIACLILGALHSVEAALGLALLAHALRLHLLGAAVERVAGISTRSVVSKLGPTAALAFVSCGAALGVRLALVHVQTHPAWVLIAAGSTAAFVYLTLLIWTKHPVEAELRRAFKSMRSSRRRTPI